MRRIPLAWLLALLALLSAAPQSLAAWMCEGRACSSSLLACCCVTPAGERDRNCDDVPAGTNVSSASQAGAATACNSGCNCVLTLKDGGTVRATNAALALPALAPAILSRPIWFLAPTPTATLVGSLETRGPPLLSTCLAVPVLRGPPVLTSSNLGS